MGGCKGSGFGHLGGVRGLGCRAFGQEDFKKTRQEFRTSVGIALLCALYKQLVGLPKSFVIV